MDWKLIFSIGIPSLLVFAGWFLTHWLTVKRDLASKKRESRLRALEAAYMRLATSSNRDFTPESSEKMETFVSEIQLYGTPHQIKLMTELVEAFKLGGTVSYDPLLEDLRNTIRAQLELEPVTGPVWWMRVAGKSQQTPAVNSSSPKGIDDKHHG